MARRIHSSLSLAEKNSYLARTGLGHFFSFLLTLLQQDFPIANRQQPLESIEANGVRAHEDARFVAPHTTHDSICGGLRRSDCVAVEASQIQLADRRMNSRSDASVFSDGSADSSRVDARDADRSSFEFVAENFRESPDRELAGAVGRLARGRDDAVDARDIDNVRAGLVAQHWKKISDAVHDPPKIDAHQPLEIGDADFFKKAVESHPGVVDEKCYALVLLDDLGSELLHSSCVGHIHKMSGDVKFPFASSLSDFSRGFLQARVVHIRERE